MLLYRLLVLVFLLDPSEHAVNPFSFGGDGGHTSERRSRIESPITIKTTGAPQQRSTMLLFAAPSSVLNNINKNNNDSDEELSSVRSWKSTSATASSAKIVYIAPSLLDSNASVQVKERTDGWHTLGIVGGPTKSIYHGVFQKNAATGLVDPSALGPSEYVRTMASAALSLAVASTTPPSPMRFLHMGYGSGSLMRLLRHVVPESRHEAIELDPTVVEAASELGLFDPDSPCERVLVGDALAYRNNDEGRGDEPGPRSYENERSSSTQEHSRFHGICIDVFDGENLMPSGFYSVPFLQRMYEDVLVEISPRGGGDESQNEIENENESNLAFVIHNFHVGNEKLEQQLQQAMAAYRTVFGNNDLHSLYRVDSLNTNNHGGNVILIAIKKINDDTDDGGATRSFLELAGLANETWKNTRFDVAFRMDRVRPF